MIKSRQIWLKYSVYGITAILGIVFDDVHSARLYALLALFGALLALNLLRDFKGFGTALGGWIYLVDGALLLTIEWQSRYVINHFFHIFYLFILAELFAGQKRHAVSAASLVAILSMGKFYTLLSQRQSLGAISETLFFLFVSILIVVSGALTQRYRREKEEKESLYRELLTATGELEKMTRHKERTRIARDIHDTLGHEMSALIMQLEMASRLIEQDTAEAVRILDGAKESSRSGLRRVREVIEALREEHLDIRGDLEVLFEDYTMRTGVEVERSYECDFSGFWERECLYRLVQEALTNTVRHSDAKRFTVRLVQEGQKLMFRLADNGSERPRMKEGYGLRGMGERIRLSGGHLEIGYEGGFVLSGWLPMGRQT